MIFVFWFLYLLYVIVDEVNKFVFFYLKDMILERSFFEVMDIDIKVDVSLFEVLNVGLNEVIMVLSLCWDVVNVGVKEISVDESYCSEVVMLLWLLVLIVRCYDFIIDIFYDIIFLCFYFFLLGYYCYVEI